MQEQDVLIVGGGAAGLMCALTAGRRGRRVVVIEHANRVGKKILMSGGGRCNFTNTGTGPEHFISANPHFCKSALARFTPRQFIAMVEHHGISYHEKELGQLFCDDSSKRIVDLLLTECAEAGVRVLTDCRIERVQHAVGAGFAVSTTHGLLAAPALVVASGGLSIPRMGASGFGYQLARQFGHELIATRAGLVPLTLSGKHQEQFADLSGVSLPVTARCKGRQFSHDLLITHRGISGPAILQISSYWQPGDDLRLDLLPGMDAHAALQQARTERPAAELKTVLGEWLPRRLAQRLTEGKLLKPAAQPEVGFGSRPMRQYTPTELRQIAAQLHDFPLIASGSEGYRSAEVTLGGVATEQISSTSMQSRIVPGLYFIGEVLDVGGWLGGYNFQWAWASGHAAGAAV
ncbi:MAG: NAD(P)/FAD-dependent oxidoreductase [Lysobacterales bacterium]